MDGAICPVDASYLFIYDVIIYHHNSMKSMSPASSLRPTTAKLNLIEFAPAAVLNTPEEKATVYFTDPVNSSYTLLYHTVFYL